MKEGQELFIPAAVGRVVPNIFINEVTNAANTAAAIHDRISAAAVPAQPDHTSTGMMVALYPPPDVAASLAEPGGLPPEDLHVTLAYMGKTDTDLPADLPIEDLIASIEQTLASHSSFTGTVGGLGQFPEGDDGIPVFAPVDVPGLHFLHEDICTALEAVGLPAYTNHGFTPHMTLAYTDTSDHGIAPREPHDVTFSSVTLKIGDETYEFALEEEDDMTVTAAAAPSADTRRGKFVRLYFSEGERTADRRVIDPNSVSLTKRPPPYPFRLQTKQPENGGHAGAELAGTLNKVFRDGHTLIVEGPLDLNSAAGAEAERLLREGVLATWSPDLGDVVSDLEILAMDEDGHPTDYLEHVVEGTFLGGTMVAIPALGSAVIELLDEDGEVLVPAPTRVSHPEPAQGSSTDGPIDVLTDVSESAELLTAAANPSDPPLSHFSDPKLPSLQRYITITPDNRVYGHLAGWGECHIGHLNVCIEPPRSRSDYSYFKIGQVRTREGTLVATGALTLRGGHANNARTAAEAQAHYDNTDSAFAYVNVGEDEHGIWFSGYIPPDVDEFSVRRARASGISGDWRQINSNLELIGACSVNVPGFPKVRLTACADCDGGQIVSLVAAGGAPLPDPTLATDELADMRARLLALETVFRDSGLYAAAIADMERDFIAELAVDLA